MRDQNSDPNQNQCGPTTASNIFSLLFSEEHVEEICRMTEGYSGADMANLCKEAAMGPIRYN